MELVVTSEDDKDTLNALREQAKLMRKKGSPQAAITAAKIELFFSKGLEEIDAAQPPQAEQ